MRGIVGTLRVSVQWERVEPRPEVFDDAELDALVRQASSTGLRVLPVLSGRPSWLPGGSAASPVASVTARRAWGSFVAHLAGRYGPGGAFWRPGTVRAHPIRSWQVGNEPNFALYWPHPSPPQYARLLTTASRAIRAHDPGAQIVLAGLAPVNVGPSPSEFLRRLYRLHGIRRQFDVVALHPYSSTLSQLRYQVEQVRQVMAIAGDGKKPLLISELGVGSDGVDRSRFELGLKGQARFLRASFRLLLDFRRRWHIDGVDWFSWQDVGYGESACGFCRSAGLVDARGRPKRSWTAYRRVVLRTAVR